MHPVDGINTGIPTFLAKLWKMVNDPATDDRICWSPAGNSFIIQDQVQFWYDLLPVYYRHNNMSSFVRQLNIYGFHKVSSIENGTCDLDKEEIQFYHPNFQRNKPELLQHIKRKVPSTRVVTVTQPAKTKSEELTKLLSEVNNIRGKQANFDTQLSAIKQENGVLWRELAVLRQKHSKQQNLINKLIHFLVTIVNPPSNSRMNGLGVKRAYPLMLKEAPNEKKTRKDSNSTTSEGLTIHELDSSNEVLPGELLLDGIITSPSSPGSEGSQQKSSLDLLEEGRDTSSPPVITLNYPEYVDDSGNPINVEELLTNSELNEVNNVGISAEQVHTLGNIESLNGPGNIEPVNDKVFLNSTAQDTLLTDLITGSYNKDSITKNSKQTKPDECANSNEDRSDLSVAKIKTYNRLNSPKDFNVHFETTQKDIEQLKELLSGCSSFDANTLLGLFNHDAPNYGLSYNSGDIGESSSNKSDPLFSGSELMTYDSGAIDFSDLLDDDFNVLGERQEIPDVSEEMSSINTPKIESNPPTFPLKLEKDSN